MGREGVGPSRAEERGMSDSVLAKLRSRRILFERKLTLDTNYAATCLKLPTET